MSAPALHRLLDEAYPGARVEPLGGDASTRRFLRLSVPSGRSLIVMDYGESFEGETDDVRLARVFRAAGLPVAEIERVLPEAGCLLLEDLGDRTLQRALETQPAEALYERAVDLAVAVASRGTRALAESTRPAGLALDSERFRFEMGFFLEHFVRGRLDSVPDGRLVEALYDLADAAADTPARVLCHRDFHSRNLMVRDDGSLAMVDIQDARWGPDAYDLASLLRDAYVEIPEDLVERMIDRFLLGRPETGGFRERFGIVGAQRMIKALGTFGFQLHVRDNRVYLDAERRLRRRLARVLAADDRHHELLAFLEVTGVFSFPEDD